MALAYLLGKASAKSLNVNPNIPLLLVLSLLPDIDIIFAHLTGLELHRGFTHSLFFAVAVFIPFFLFYGKQAVPYFLALISHAFIGDFIVGGQLQLFWPFTTSLFGLHEAGFMFIDIYSSINIALELSLFSIALLVMVITRDYRLFFKNKKTNLVLIIPLVTVLLPTILGYPFNEALVFTSPIMAGAHLFYLVLFSIAVLTVLLPKNQSKTNLR
jgi:membrane-bound metal-dependent hydrolase YbcI (DUF457 family)